jgi:RNA-directed DNA polymerase
MNKEKSKLINLWDDKQGFDFLGMHHRKIPKKLKGNKTVSILRSYPSKKAMKSMRQKVKEVTEPRNRLYWTMNKMVEELNPKIQGWKNYYGLDVFANPFPRSLCFHVLHTLYRHKKIQEDNEYEVAL